MESLQIPTSIWINLGLLIAAAGFVRYRLRATSAARKTDHQIRSSDRIQQAAGGNRTAPADL